MDMAQAIGFESVHRYQGLAKAEKQAAKTPLMFFLCAPAKDVRTLKPMVNAVRFSPSLKLRFLPLIYFTREPSLETVKQCIAMGFDDVIALPIGGDDAGDRIARQIGRIRPTTKPRPISAPTGATGTAARTVRRTATMAAGRSGESRSCAIRRPVWT